jgi:hypothetical protein
VTRAAAARSTLQQKQVGMSAAGRLISGEGVMSFALLRAAAVAAISLVMALPAVAQEHFTARLPDNPLVIPDNPCMTPEQRKKLQLLHDEWSLENDRASAAGEQWSSLDRRNDIIDSYDKKGFFETSDDPSQI